MRHTFLCAGLAACSPLAFVTILDSPVAAQEDRERDVQLPAQPLAEALREVGRTFGRNVSFDAQVVAGREAPAVEGSMRFEQALAALLANSGLEAGPAGNGVVIRPVVNRERGGRGPASEILVTGSRIRGAPVAATTIEASREDMIDAGQSSLADLFRSIPQNFGGGQNPGIGFNVPEGSGFDLAGGASVNLRGLGSDATLTLLNGHRLSYDAAAQSVDISAIPFGAIEHVAIIPDGASALFGSDAVAGVVNIVLRNDLDGLETGAQLAGSTDGGNFRQQYNVTAGRQWRGGNVLLAYEFARNTPIEAEERSYAAGRSPGLTLYPRLKHHNAALVLAQDIGTDLTFSFDGLFNQRDRQHVSAMNPAGHRDESRLDQWQTSKSWAAAPSLHLSLPAEWEIALSGSYGWNKVWYAGAYVYDGVPSSAGAGVYRNATWNAELFANGKLADLPAGGLKLAAGAGFRRNEFKRESDRGILNFIDQTQDSYYAFGELSVPLIGEGQSSALGRRFDLSLAARHEHYRGIGSVTTPKLGLIYSPNDDFTFKASWGKSFRAATLYEQYLPTIAYLQDITDLGGAPGTEQTAIVLDGGNAQLRPERSTNWSASLVVHPRGLDGTELEISYFSVHYRNRIVTPIPYESVALSDPRYAPRVSYAPDIDAQNAAIDRGVAFRNFSSFSYDPADVLAIVDNTNVNAGRQRASGVDVLGRYQRELGRGTLTASANASYIESNQQITASEPVTQLAGMLFNPPHFQARGELSWAEGQTTLTGAVSYTGSVTDGRAEPHVKVASMVPFDVILRFQSPARAGWTRGIDIVASVQNLFNDKPAPIATTSYRHTPYDSTNYLPFGRVLSLSISKAW